MTVTMHEAVVDYLEKCGLIKTARVMRKELKTVKDIVLEGDKEKNLLSKFPSLLWTEQTRADSRWYP